MHINTPNIHTCAFEGLGVYIIHMFWKEKDKISKTHNYFFIFHIHQFKVCLTFMHVPFTGFVYIIHMFWIVGSKKENFKDTQFIFHISYSSI